MDTLRKKTWDICLLLLLHLAIQNSKAHNCTVHEDDHEQISLICSKRGLYGVPSDLPTKSVVSLDLSSNHLGPLADSTFASFTDLRNLTLLGNTITTYSENAFLGLDYLENLDLTLNWLEEMPYPLCTHMPKLNNFTAIYSTISQVPNNVFSTCTEMRYIYMAQAGLQEIGTAFSGLSNLELLYLTDNFAMQISSADAFKNNKNLTKLDLRSMGSSFSTKLDHLPPSVLEISSLETLRVSKSRFSTFSKSDTDFFDKLKVLYAGENPFTCTCDTTDFITWFQHTDLIPDSEKNKYDCSSHCDNCPESNLMKDYNVKTCGGVTVWTCHGCVIIITAVTLAVVAVIAIVAVVVLKRKEKLCFKNKYANF